ncbi:uncharacterized protein LOC143446613 isoform X1 [Clavelina lepadiformis]|uniref:uncharacterized protein LOC143446613 isoform X1 n=1 Tax=Clavelina lepadiformis TaxID=159417 RepID=UPI0040439409
MPRFFFIKDINEPISSRQEVNKQDMAKMYSLCVDASQPNLSDRIRAYLGNLLGEKNGDPLAPNYSAHFETGVQYSLAENGSVPRDIASNLRDFQAEMCGNRNIYFYIP